MAYKRGVGKNNSDFGIKDLYKEYKSTSKNPIDFKTYSIFLKEYNDRIINGIIYENIEYKAPYRLGYFRIQRRRLTPFVINGEIKKSHILPDWKKTLDYWHKQYPGKTDEELKLIKDKKILVYLNEHTNGYSVRFLWDKSTSNIKNQNVYIFKITRTAKENIAKFIKKNGIIEYFD